MNKSGMIIRLIDVVLLLLFGFIKVSQIVFMSQIKLPPKQQQDLNLDENKEIEIISLIIDSWVDKSNNQVITRFRVYEGEDRSRDFDNLRDLEDYLIARTEPLKETKKPYLVLLEPHPESLLQTTVDILDICKRNNLEQSIKAPDFRK